MNQTLFPTLDDDGYCLIDGEERNRNFDTFEIPQEVIRNNLIEGIAVKLGFSIKVTDEEEGFDIANERMWVYVTEVNNDMNGNKYYVGTLANQPVYSSCKLQYGDEIKFRPKHVIGFDLEYSIKQMKELCK